MRISFVLFVLAALMLAGCGGGEADAEMATPIATFTPAPTLQVADSTPTVAATATPLPTSTPTSEPTATATATVAATLAATATPTAEATATPLPPAATPTPQPEESGAENPDYAGLPDELLALLPDADAANGQALTVSNACTACHSLEKDVKLVGPSWYGVGATAGERVEGQSAGLYLYTSIVEPNAYINEGYVAGLMPQTYGETLDDGQMADIIAYLLTLRGE